MNTFRYMARNMARLVTGVTGVTGAAGTLLVLATFSMAPPQAQAQTRPFVTARAYPAGGVATAGISRGWSTPTEAGQMGESLQFEAGIWAGTNLTRRRDWGEHDDERGGGLGGGVELTWFPGRTDAGWFTGVRTSIWSMEIEWRDDPQTPLGPARVGETDILVVQPTVRGGYRFRLGGRLRLDAEAALGAEINAMTDGEDVGQGAIALAGLRLVY